MLQAKYIKHELRFNEAGGTSRGVLYAKTSWFIQITDSEGATGVGECSIIPGLSYDNPETLELKIREACQSINEIKDHFHNTYSEYPALRFALEMAFRGLQQKDQYILFPSSFTKGEQSICINGLIWMGRAEEMLKRIDDKLSKGFSCLKLKVGAIEFNQELELLKHIRQRYSVSDLELRVDANGAFTPGDALKKIDELSAYQLHSIEQPIYAGQMEEMKSLCSRTSIPIALDEELIGVHQLPDKKKMLEFIKPQYIILKPGLIGGFRASDEWIDVAKSLNINWWATSALESNVGLNAIAQWSFTKQNKLRQGLGTGQVFKNNIDSPLHLVGENLFYDSGKQWGNPFINIPTNA